MSEISGRVYCPYCRKTQDYYTDTVFRIGVEPVKVRVCGVCHSSIPGNPATTTNQF